MFLKIWSGKERSGEMISNSGTLNHGSVNDESKSPSTQKKKSVREDSSKKEKNVSSLLILLSLCVC